MKKNVGSWDRILRFVIGAVIIALGIIYQSWWGLIGIIPLFTALTRSCLIYVPFGISTCKVKTVK
ncbi:MAG: hypothetical protein A2V66_04090 [Ignavibacteria bacterium RBG_13_36_8]|nr:MAG: hypothetical protein A2V66_04090 [Ignavibacteria bacterium RBG_13_36_8]